MSPVSFPSPNRPASGIRRLLRGAAALCLPLGLLVLAGCASPHAEPTQPANAPASEKTAAQAAPAKPETLTPGRSIAVTGTLSYRERMALPAGVTVRVQVLDVSEGDIPGRVIAGTEFDVDSQVPIPFTVRVDSASVIKGHGFGVQAQLVKDGKQLFASPAPMPVELEKEGPVEPTNLVLARLSK